MSDGDGGGAEVVFGTQLFATGLSEVYSGRWRKTPESAWYDVVLKSVYKTSYDASGAMVCFRNELDILKELRELEPDGDFFIRLYDVVDLDTQFVLVLQKGEQDVYECFASMPEINAQRSKRALKIMRDMTQALLKLHNLDYTHNDVKPENFLLCGTQVVLIDFGFASKNSKNKRQRCSTNPFGTSAKFGTEIYMTPNLFDDAYPMFGANDLFGLGMSFFVLYAHMLPFGPTFTEPVKLRIRRSFMNGTWLRTVHIDERVCKQPKYEEWCDLVSKLCSGYWHKACDEILLHPMFCDKPPIAISQLQRCISEGEEQVLLHL